MSQTAVTTPEPADTPQIVDVWSRTSRRYRRRSVFMLLVLALLFAGLCCFSFWLRTGVYWPWMCDAYPSILARSFQPTGADQITLSDFLTSPISVQDVWVHGIIMGLLLASLSSIPLLVAILYRFPFSIIFAVMVMFLAAMPWLGITVLGGCALTALRPLRFSFRYASALIGLIPVAVYFVSASLEPAGTGPKLTQHQALLYAPWVLAVLGSCIICALALAVARLINYRPGGIPPVLALLFAIPVFLFHSQVGRDELEYRLLEREIGPGSRTMFVPVDVGAQADQAATRRWSEARDTSYDEIQKQMLARAVYRLLLRTEVDRARAVARCDSFIERFRESPHVPEVLYLKGRVLDQRIQRAGLQRDHRAAFHCDVPSRSSRRTWQTLSSRFPESTLSAMALYKLALLDARAGQGADGSLAASARAGGDGIGRAIEVLAELIRRFDLTRPAAPPDDLLDVPRPTLALPSGTSADLGLDLVILIRQARRLKEMMDACQVDEAKPYSTLFGPRPRGPEVAVHPIQLLLRLDDTDPNYKTNLQGIAGHFAGSRCAGYVENRLALLEKAISRRIQRFRAAADSLAGQPAGAQALYYLGETLVDDSILDEAKVVFDEVIRMYPDSCWTLEAKDRLSSLSMLEAVAE